MDGNVQHATTPPWAAEWAERHTVAAMTTRHASPGAALAANAEGTPLTPVAC